MVSAPRSRHQSHLHHRQRIRGDIPLFHFDLYRLGSSDELFDIGWEDYLARGGVCAVEWSERAEDAFDGSTVRIDFRRSAQHDGWRVITITGVDGL